MKELNELVEQAKFVADWHGSDWSSALCQGKDGKQAHEIICESRGEAVISTGSNSNEASWLCNYLELCSPENILAIAKAFHELKQRAEAAEAKLEVEKDIHDDTVQAMNIWCERANVAEAKLAELENQKPVAYVHPAYLQPGALGFDASVCRLAPAQIPLFTRPAPAVSLAELVPDEMPEAAYKIMSDKFGDGSCMISDDMWSECRDAIMRKIDNAGKRHE